MIDWMLMLTYLALPYLIITYSTKAEENIYKIMQPFQIKVKLEKASKS
jgi:hypothetical protein